MPVVKKKVLVVEDNELNLKLFKMVLQFEEAELVEARTGPEALLMITREHPDLVILDIQLPCLTGLEVAKQVRQDPSLNPVILVAVTALAMAGDRERALNAGCNYYVPKPIDTRSFREAILGILRGDSPPLLGKLTVGR